MGNGSKKYWFQDDLLISVGNTKLGLDTIILNMSSALDCPSRTLGLCKIPHKCYAAKAETLYPNARPYRDRQRDYWINNTPEKILGDLMTMLSKAKRAKEIKYFRFNEAGDFHSQNCVDKLSVIATHLKRHLGINSYGYTARSDLGFPSTIPFVLRGSGHSNAPHGKTIVRKLTAYQKSKRCITIDNERYSVCPMDCKICSRCKTRRQMNIVFPLH